MEISLTALQSHFSLLLVCYCELLLYTNSKLSFRMRASNPILEKLRMNNSLFSSGNGATSIVWRNEAPYPLIVSPFISTVLKKDKCLDCFWVNSHSWICIIFVHNHKYGNLPFFQINLIYVWYVSVLELWGTGVFHVAFCYWYIHALENHNKVWCPTGTNLLKSGPWVTV